MFKSDRVKSVEAALWTVAHRAYAIYSEASNRMDSVDRPYQLPFIADCSAACICWWAWAGFIVKGLTYTGTLLTMQEHLAKMHEVGRKVDVWNVVAGDVVIFGEYPGVHAAFIVHACEDPVVVSHGHQGDPEITTVMSIQRADGPAFDTVTYLHFPLRKRIVKRRTTETPVTKLKTVSLKNIELT